MSSLKPQTLRIGISPCPNDVYIFAGLILGEVGAAELPLTFDYQDVETLNAAAKRGVYDIAKISYAAYAAIQDEYELLDCGGALGRGVGPLLLSNGNAPFDPTRETLVPGEQTTAHFLLQFYAARLFGRSPLKKRYLPFDDLYAELCNRPGAQGVVIHENRFTYQRDNLTLLQDLGELWEAQTHHAIPLGAIAVRRNCGLRERVTPAIQASLDWAEAHPAETIALCRRHSQQMDDDVLKAHINLYVNEYTRDLGDEGRDAAAFFLSEQRKFAER